jgi:hypothetical protein
LFGAITVALVGASAGIADDVGFGVSFCIGTAGEPGGEKWPLDPCRSHCGIGRFMFGTWSGALDGVDVTGMVETIPFMP